MLGKVLTAIAFVTLAVGTALAKGDFYGEGTI